jgi:hypothetical protein
MQQVIGGKVNFVLMRYYFSTPEAFIFSIWLIITLVSRDCSLATGIICEIFPAFTSRYDLGLLG